VVDREELEDLELELENLELELACVRGGEYALREWADGDGVEFGLLIGKEIRSYYKIMMAKGLEGKERVEMRKRSSAEMRLVERAIMLDSGSGSFYEQWLCLLAYTEVYCCNTMVFRFMTVLGCRTH
jgi:hypothetical protein